MRLAERISALNDKVKVSVNDTTSDYLLNKLVAGIGITLTENNNGLNESITISTTSGAISGLNISMNQQSKDYLELNSAIWVICFSFDQSGTFYDNCALYPKVHSIASNCLFELGLLSKPGYGTCCNGDCCPCSCGPCLSLDLELLWMGGRLEG